MATDTTVRETGDDALDILLDPDIDRVMAGLDRIVEAAPSYKKLFSRWEHQQWNSESFDFSRDKAEWESDAFTDEQREFMLWSLSSFFLGEERVTTELLPFAIAAPPMRRAPSSPPRSATRPSTWSSSTASTARCSASMPRRSAPT